MPIKTSQGKKVTYSNICARITSFILLLIPYNDETWHSYTLPKENPKNIWITRHTPWLLLTINNFCYIKKYRYKFHFLGFLKICLINLAIILMMAAKMATPGLLKTTVFWNKNYDVIIFVDNVTNRILSRDSNYVVDVFMWPKFGNCSISMGEVIRTSFL